MLPFPAYINSLGIVSAAGCSPEALRCTLLGRNSGAMQTYTGLPPQPDAGFCLGLVGEKQPEPERSRTSELLEVCFSQMPELTALRQKIPVERIGVVLGACTAGMNRLERKMTEFVRNGTVPEGLTSRDVNLLEPAQEVAQKIGARGPVYTVSNACASGLMSMISAAKLLAAGVCDAVVAGGVDGFCHFTNAGFSALGAVSRDLCRPFCRDRSGINLGEGGALVLMTRSKEGALFALAGAGLTTDAHHMSAPEPSGAQPAQAMRLALQSAGLAPGDIDLVSAHGTGTPLNDAMESAAVQAVFSDPVPCASYKALSGHTLAGAGALQAAIAAVLLTGNPEGRIPANSGRGEINEAIGADIVNEPRALGRPLKAILANAFAFGGSNASAVFTAV